MFNPAITQLEAPPVAQVQNWISQYDNRNGALIDLSQAVPGYSPHPDLLNSFLKEAADTNILSYGAIEGEEILRNAYAKHCSELYKTKLNSDEVLITSGCNQAFVIAALTVASLGDSVLMVRPYYFNHSASLAMMGIETQFIDAKAEDKFIPSIESIAKAIKPKTKALALVNPNNPTGAIYSPQIIKEIYTLCQEHGIWLIIDETYRDFILSDQAPHDLLKNSDWQNNLIMLYSFSKSYAIPSYRLGAVIAGEDTIKEMTKIMDNIQICAPRAAQRAVAPMIEKLNSWRGENTKLMGERADAFTEVFSEFKNWNIASLGGYFGYVRHPFAESSIKVAERITREAGVLTIPGEFFGEGQEQFLRFAFANAEASAIKTLPERFALL